MKLKGNTILVLIFMALLALPQTINDFGTALSEAGDFAKREWLGAVLSRQNEPEFPLAAADSVSTSLTMAVCSNGLRVNESRRKSSRVPVTAAAPKPAQFEGGAQLLPAQFEQVAQSIRVQEEFLVPATIELSEAQKELVNVTGVTLEMVPKLRVLSAFFSPHDRYLQKLLREGVLRGKTRAPKRERLNPTRLSVPPPAKPSPRTQYTWLEIGAPRTGEQDADSHLEQEAVGPFR